MSRIKRVASLVGAAIILVIGTATTNWGGFELRVEQPVSGNAVLVVEAFGCHQPEQARIEGTAEGLVDGARQSLPLTLESRADGVYDVMWEQPEEGMWVLAFTGTYRGHVSSLLVEVNDQGQVELPEPDRYGRRVEPLQRSLTLADVELALKRHTHAG